MFEPSALLDLLRLRKLVESGIMPEVVRRIQPDELDKCRQIFTEWEANLNAGLPYSEQDRLFHQMLYQVAGNQMLADLADVFWIAYRNAEANTIPAARKGMSVLARHREILQAIEAKDVGRAQDLIAGDRELEERLELALGHTSE
jgi:DNA-binding FadR family transcriptional regulator